jgi:hypothetical protein
MTETTIAKRGALTWLGCNHLLPSRYLVRMLQRTLPAGHRASIPSKGEIRALSEGAGFDRPGLCLAWNSTNHDNSRPSGAVAKLRDAAFTCCIMLVGKRTVWPLCRSDRLLRA